MKYAFIQRHRQAWPITVQCRVLGVSASGYHAHRAGKASTAPRRHLSDDALLVHIKAVHAQTRGSYGRPRILRELRHDGVRVGKQRLQRLMRARLHVAFDARPFGSNDVAPLILVPWRFRSQGSAVHDPASSFLR